MDRLAKWMALWVLSALVTVPGSGFAFVITIDYSEDGGFFGDPTRRDTLEAAAGFFEGIITDDLLEIDINSGPPGVNTWTGSFSNPGTGDPDSVTDRPIAADTIIVYAGGRDLGGGTLGSAGPGGFSASGTQTFVDTVRNRGEVGLTIGPGATEVAPWGGSVAFNDTTNWFFDTDPSTDEPFSGFDFFSVALHEFGHVLGMGIVDSWDELVVGGIFTGTEAVAVRGGGGPILVTGGGGHWAAGTQGGVGGAGPEAAMDPDIGTSTRKRFTPLDIAGLDDIGWDIASASASSAPSTALAQVATKSRVARVELRRAGRGGFTAQRGQPIQRRRAGRDGFTAQGDRPLGRRRSDTGR